MRIHHDQERIKPPNQVKPALKSSISGLELVRSPALDNPLREGFRLDEWQVHPVEGSLVGHRGAAHLEPKVMEVLVLLASYAGQLVERDFLIREIWGKRTVSDEPLTRCIAILRRTFGESPKQPRYIQTVPKRGYRLIADVATASGAMLDSSIAVLPFENMSSDPDNGFFADGIQNDLLNKLAKIDALTVISRTSVLEYRGGPKNMRDIGQELGVATIVEGSVRRSGDTVRVNVDLIDAQTDKHLWVETYDRQLTPESIFVIQNAMATSIANALQAELSSGSAARNGTAAGQHDTMALPADSGNRCGIDGGRLCED